MTKAIDDEDMQKLEVKKKFHEDLEKLRKQEVPEDIRNFLTLLENIKKDPAALQSLKDEIIKNYGK